MRFHPEATPFVIVESVEMIRQFTGKFTWEGYLFSLWYSMKYPETLQESDFKTAIVGLSAQFPIHLDLSLMAELLKSKHLLPQENLEQLLPGGPKS